MTDADLLAFLRHFAATRDWRTWTVISDAYADDGDELGAAIAVRIRDGKYWPFENYTSYFKYPIGVTYRWTWAGDCPIAIAERTKNAVPDDAITAVYKPGVDPSSTFPRRRYPCATVEDAYRRLIDAFRVGMASRVDSIR